MGRIGLALALVLTAATGFGEEGGNSDVIVVDATNAPSSVAMSKHDQKRLKDLQATLPSDHKVRLEFRTLSPEGSQTIRHLIRLTPLNAKGKPNGQEVEYADWYRRAMHTTEFQNGQRQGLESQYDVDSGVLVSETPWEKDMIQGVKRTFHTNGKLMNESTFVKGVVEGQSRTLDPEGNLIRVVNYEHGKRQGDSIDYWSEKPDAVKRVVPYKKDVVDGTAKEFYLNGKLKWERPFRNNKQHGVEKQYSADGTLEKTMYWLAGNPVSEDEFRKKAK